MAVYDQWHKAAAPGDKPCECGTKARPLYPSWRHKTGDRWQVRYRDPEGKQKKKSFAKRVGQNPAEHADAFDAQVSRDVDTGNYTDPKLAETTFAAYAETWRKGRGYDAERAAAVERRLRLHAYEGEPGSGRTPRGGVSIGQHALGLLARRPSLTQAWIQAMPLADATRRLVIGDVSAVYRAAIDDGIIGRDPTRAGSVTRPAQPRTKARPWTAAQAGAMRDALPARYAIIPELGAGTGCRQGELFGLAVQDVQFLGRRPHVRVERQVKIVAGQLRFAPIKNRKPHSVPLSPLLAERLARHMELHPPAEVKLPWHDPRDRERHGQPVTVRLVLTGPAGGALVRPDFNDQVWRPALVAAGIAPPRAKGRKRISAPQDGMHALRHTFASVQLRSGVDVVRVAGWMGDTPAVVYATYAHMLPGDDDADGRTAVDGFIAEACAPDVPREEVPGASAQAGPSGRQKR